MWKSRSSLGGVGVRGTIFARGFHPCNNRNLIPLYGNPPFWGGTLFSTLVIYSTLVVSDHNDGYWGAGIMSIIEYEFAVVDLVDGDRDGRHQGDKHVGYVTDTVSYHTPSV